MKTVDLSAEDMASRVARFKDLVPYKQSIMDNTGIPAEAIEVVSAKSVYPLMTPANWKGRSAVAPVTGKDGLVVTIAECAGQQSGTAQSFEYGREFLLPERQVRVSWGPDGENSIELEPLDFVSVPAGVYRDFNNISDETARLLVMIQTPEGDVEDEVVYHPRVGEEIVEKFGADTLAKMDEIGFRMAAE